MASTTPYLGRFGGSRLTPAPRFSPSSSTRVPLRDYHVYGIYPNKTIVRKRPEDNLIDARNVDSPYVIFGIYPDGRLVRKFPNGTIIPDPPSNPVEVVFSLSTTTTTNRPQPPVFYYNQANQGTFNQYQAPNYYNNRRPVGNTMKNGQYFGDLDLGLTGNAIGGSNGGGADFLGPLGTPGSVATTNTMVSLSHILKFVHHKSLSTIRTLIIFSSGSVIFHFFSILSGKRRCCCCCCCFYFLFFFYTNFLTPFFLFCSVLFLHSLLPRFFFFLVFLCFAKRIDTKIYIG